MAVPKKDQLKTYRKRRDFTRSPEPTGSTRVSKKNLFVIQKHAARSLHYDFRINIGGVLKSWAIPKGPSLNPAHKRLAVPTDDHPIEYAKFEGTIPEGEYGAGTVMVWDIGTYKNIKKKNDTLVPMATCYRQGRIEIFVKGKKIYGGYALIRTANDQWLLIKMNDEHAHRRKNPVNTQNKSALSGRTMHQIKRGVKKEKV